MDIILSAIDDTLAHAWDYICGDLDNVTLHEGSIVELTCDAVVSPTNSFGFMDGGIDLLYSQVFGWHVQERLQKLIAEQHYGELLIGNAEIIATDHERIPYVIAAPTMRVPMILEATVNPYLACRAALLLIKYGLFSEGAYAGQPIARKVASVAFPGLGTGVGRVGEQTCAWQVRTAIEEVIFEQQRFPTSWWDAQERHQRLYSNTVRDLQYSDLPKVSLEEHYYTVTQLSERLQVPREIILEWIHKGRLGAVNVGNLVRIPQSALEAFIIPIEPGDTVGENEGDG